MAPPQLSAEQIAEFKDAFNLFDTDGSNTVDVDEIEAVMKQLGQKPKKSEIMEMVKEVDSKGTGEIDFDDFCSMMVKMMGGDSGDDYNVVKETFSAFDKGGNGSIIAKDLRSVLEDMSVKLTSDELGKIMGEIDPSGNGSIDYSSFCKVFMFDE